MLITFLKYYYCFVDNNLAITSELSGFLRFLQLTCEKEEFTESFYQAEAKSFRA